MAGTSDFIKIQSLLNYSQDLMIEILRLKTENNAIAPRVNAWEKGWKAYASGMRLFDNPYQEQEVFEFAFWSSAWLYAQKVSTIGSKHLIDDALTN